MKTIRLLYPDHVSGGLETYYFGANLMQYILPENKNQKLVRVAVVPPDGKEKAVTEGITGESDVVGFTVAEYLPFDEERLHQMFLKLPLFTE